MLFLFRGPHRPIAQLVIGILLLAVGIVAHAPAATLVGAVLVAWGVCSAVSGRRVGRRA